MKRDVFVSPLHLVECFEEYIQWCDDNPKLEDKFYGNEGKTGQLAKMRIPTEQGFQRFMRMGREVMKGIRAKGGDWLKAAEYVEDCMYAITIEGAASGLLKESIVIKKLNMADKIEITTTAKRVIIFTPDNSRAIPAPPDEDFQDAELLD